MGGDIQFLITCEHGGNRIPPRYRELFAGQEALLQSHRGHDPGALAMARDLARALEASLFYATTSRLLVDLNRSPRHPRLFSERTRPLPARQRQDILSVYYWPYRSRAEQRIAQAIDSGQRVIHLSSHSFTPELDGVVRQADVGLLYDPARPGEIALCRAWQTALKQTAPRWRVRCNYPYTGKSDGFTAWLRRRFPAERYIGVELEINQQVVKRGGQAWRQLRADLVGSLVQTLAQVTWK